MAMIRLIMTRLSPFHSMGSVRFVKSPIMLLSRPLSGL